MPGRVAVRATNLEGDRQADLRVHGGPDKAVYLYPAEHYPHWREVLAPAELGPGWFGENLTTRGLLEDETWIGDVFRVGGALLEVSQPRVPCAKLAMKSGDPAFGRPFLQSGFSGFYLRVLEEGEVGAGDADRPRAPRRGRDERPRGRRPARRLGERRRPRPRGGRCRSWPSAGASSSRTGPSPGGGSGLERG